MQCPYCNNEMMLGVINFGFRSSAEWKPNGDGGEIKKIVLVPYNWGYDEIEAYFCNSCKKMVMDLNDLQTPEPLFSFMKRHNNGTLTR